MKQLSFLMLVFSSVILTVSCTNMIEQNNQQMRALNEPDEFTVVFACEHGSAKSVVAAAHFNKLAAERNLKARAISRGTDPDEIIPLKVLQGLAVDGLVAGETGPKLLAQADVAGAARVVAFCPLPADYQKLAPVEQWTDVPPISDDYDRSRDEIVKRINRLLDELN